MIKKILVVIIATLMLLASIVLEVEAAATNPYCRISYDSAVGCNTVKYYSYKNDIARYDATRLVKFYDGKILLGTSNTVVTTNHKSGTNPAWTTDGSHLVWIDSENTLWARSYSTNQNVSLRNNVSSLGLNAESMVETVSFADGKSVAISTLLSDTTTTPVEPEETPTTEQNQPSSQPSTKSQLTEWTDNKGREHFSFGSNKLVVYKADVYLNKFKISELCNSGVRFVGVDSSYRVYLYEDASNSYYRFDPKNIFVPKKIRFANKGTLLSVITDSNGFVTKVVTTSGTYKLSQLTKKTRWQPPISYVINKSGYCTYYVAKSSKKYTLSLKGQKLYLGKKLIATGINKKSSSFGFANKKIYYVKNGKIYSANLATPKKATFEKNGKKLTYSSKNGFVKIAK